MGFTIHIGGEHMATPKYGYGTAQQYGSTVGYTNKDDEIQRTIDVIKNKKASGMDVSPQLSWYKQLTGSNYVDTFDTEGYKDQINKLYDSQKQSQLAQLQAERDKAIGEINQQKKNTGAEYTSARNQTDATNLQNAQRLREVMASSGLLASGENVTGNVAMNNQRLSGLNALNLQEQQAYDDFNRRIADINNPAEQNALIAALEAERARALLDLGMRADEIGYSRNRDNINDQWREKEWDYGVGRDKIADERYDREWQNTLDQQDLEESWRQKEWNELSPAEKAAAELDYQYFLKKKASSSGGGGRSYGGSSGGSSSKSSLSSAYQQYQKEKQGSSSTPADKYYQTMENIMKGSVVRKNPVIPVPSIGSNPNLSNYDKLQMIKQQYGIR